MTDHRRIGALALLSLLLVAGPAGATRTTLHVFGGADGFASQAPLVADAGGNLYGTTASGGTANRGVVFELSPPQSPGGAWTYTILHSFGGRNDGADSLGGLVLGPNGVLYGTTYMGGAYDQGTVFEVSPPRTAGGPWGEAVLYSFGANHDFGYWPAAGLLRGAHGALYGTTSYGGADQAGLVFALLPPAGAGQPWTENVLYAFQTNGATDGYSPQAPLAADAKGDLYGTTVVGGAPNQGTVFELTPQAGGGYAERVIYAFGSQAGDGSQSRGSVLIGAGGVLYGTTDYGGTDGAGTVFRLTPGAGGWTEQVIYSFANNNIDGIGPLGALALDSQGRLYGTTPYGGTEGFGTLYRLSPRATGPWSEAILHAFTSGLDGSTPFSLYMASNGTLYGTTSAGGSPADGRWGYGVVYAYTP